MSDNRDVIIKYRLGRASEALEEAVVLWNTAHYNTYVNRLYYACFYAVSALLLKNGFTASTHSGTQNLFAQHFVKSGKVSKEIGQFYYSLFYYRQESDYKDDYHVDMKVAEPWLMQATEFVRIIAGMAAGDAESD